MKLTTATPVEIDTAIAKAGDRVRQIDTNCQRVRAQVRRIEQVEPGSFASMQAAFSAERHAELVAKVNQYTTEIAKILREEIEPLEDEFTRRGGWTRYYLVDNSNGHVHKDRRCSTCFTTTDYSWLYEQSGMSAEDLVEEAGEQACTVCFPWAPVDVLKRKSSLETPKRKAARLEREAKEAAKAAKAAASAIVDVDGSPLYDKAPGQRYRSVIKTIRTAWIQLVDEFLYQSWGDEDGRHEANIHYLAKAIAVKENKAPEDVIATAKKKLAKRK